MTRRQHRLLFLVLPAALALGWAGAGEAAASCLGDLKLCRINLGRCSTDLTAAQGDLTACYAHLDQLNIELAACSANHSQVRTDLATCTNDLLVCQANVVAFPASGQTTAFRADKKDGIPGTVAVPDDGTLEAGAVLSYTDNGDGTITDNNTGLMWEKKSDDGGLHDKDNAYLWSGNGSQETVWDWLDDLNSEGGTGFAGYDDWRVPNVKELLSILNYESLPLKVSAAFNSNCGPGTTALTGSCTFPSRYWSSTTRANSTTSAWCVGFNQGDVSAELKIGSLRVRAVRGGAP